MTSEPGMAANDVREVLDALAEVGCPAWIAGGWGVDALAHRQTRTHRDPGLAIDARHQQAALQALTELGYVVETDWLPIRVELAASAERWVDLHPVVFDSEGNGRQAKPAGTYFEYPSTCFQTGRIGQTIVPCLSVEQQMSFHSGYEPRDVDLHDLKLLNDLQGSGPSL